jgi:hypothetical protein
MRLLLLTFSLLIFTACSPKYIVKTHYTLPPDAQGKSCVKTCSNEQKVCQAHCNQKQDDCLMVAEQSTKATFPALMREYDDILSEYYFAKDRYDQEMDLWEREERRVHQDYEHYRSSCQGKPKKTYECKRAHELDAQLHSIESHQPTPPVRPVKPSLVDEIKRAQKNCSNECGCIKTYDSCFVSCGGKLNYEKICVENCKK